MRGMGLSSEIGNWMLEIRDWKLEMSDTLHPTSNFQLLTSNSILPRLRENAKDKCSGVIASEAKQSPIRVLEIASQKTLAITNQATYAIKTARPGAPSPS
jgi:hypothetical protein